MSLMLLLRPRFIDGGAIADIVGGRYKKKHIEIPDTVPALIPETIKQAKPLITLNDLVGIELDLSSKRDRKLLESLAEEEQAILLMLMLDD